MATTNVSLEDICKQRRRQLLFTIPPPRNTIQSPYPQYTQQQLDMRRKAEILKYAGNKQNTKTNSLTRTERYAQAMRNRNRVDLTTTVNNVSCPDDTIIYTSSSASGVPGPSIPLYLDNSVPLYNYETNTQPQGIIETEITDKWIITTPENNVYFNDDESNSLFSMNITEAIDYPKYVYNISLPIAFNVTGQKKLNGNNLDIYDNLSITLDAVTPFEFSVKYNEKDVIDVSPIVSYTYDVSNLTTFSFDVSNNATNFDATLYAGILNISSIDLFTETGYIYDFHIKPKLSIIVGDVNKTSNFDVDYSVSYGILMNYKNEEENVFFNSNNCSILTNPSTKIYTPFTFSNM